jgi:hypothetical protein
MGPSGPCPSHALPCRVMRADGGLMHVWGPRIPACGTRAIDPQAADLHPALKWPSAPPNPEQCRVLPHPDRSRRLQKFWNGTAANTAGLSIAIGGLCE